MRGPKTALIVGIVLVTAVSASVLRAQQGTGPGSGTSQAIDDPPTMPRSARQLLRNGLDYLNSYQDYDRALTFFRQAEPRQKELNEGERKQLSQGIEKARRGLREGPSMARAGRPNSRPGALTRVSSSVDKPVQKASIEKTDMVEPAKLDLPVLPPVAEVVEVAAIAGEPAGKPAPMPAPTMTPAPPAELPVPLPEPVAAKPETPAPAAAPSTIVLTAEAPVTDPVPLPDPTTAEAAKPATSPELELPPAETPAPAAPTGSGEIIVPPIRMVGSRTRQAVEPAPAPVVADAPAPAAAPVEPPVIADPPAAAPPVVPDVVPAAKVPAVEPAPADVLPPAAPPVETPQPIAIPDPDALPPLPPPTAGRALREPNASPVAMSTIDTPEDRPVVNPESLREVEEIARREMQAARDQPRINPLRMGSNSGAGASEPSSIGSKAFQLPRAPSPTEPRPIRAIPVPEEFVPLQKREFEPNRKYWVAAATCHMPLYFQDAALERYGQGVEQAMGPVGRFFSYPLDDPTQSNQRNQLVQPAYSAGLFLVQFVTLPYNLIMDPPWEAEYDLGYYRPGDRVPRNTYYFPLTGVGPALHGNEYGKPKPRKGWFLPFHLDK